MTVKRKANSWLVNVERQEPMRTLTISGAQKKKHGESDNNNPNPKTNLKNKLCDSFFRDGGEFSKALVTQKLISGLSHIQYSQIDKISELC
ncbi:14935_t:CDS:2 [Dentiscutata erythropus]|uniref:14935_t:CDS:1 n=1 Tax=Dentiscutata erythropus TaxID=1348616 RepID=A0A9N9F5R1_9GLOM|nr:14935_t:CDS:2 [Dentiscutata erythropus]